MENKCVAMLLQFQTIAQLVQFLKAYLYGDLDKLFKPLQDEIRKMPGYEDYKQEVVIFQEDFYKCLDELGTYISTYKRSFIDAT